MPPESEVIEPPTKTEQPKVEKPGSLLGSVKIIKEGIEIGKTLPTEPVKEPDKKEPEKAKEPEKPELKKDAATLPKDDVITPSDDEKKQWSSGARQHFESLQKDRDDKRDKLKKAEADATAIRQENEKLKADLQKGTQNDEAVRKYEETIQNLRQELRLGSIERDPEFIEKYVESRQSRMVELQSLAEAVGATEKEFERAINIGDDDKLQEWRESLPKKGQVAFDAHLTAIANIDFEKQQAIKNAGKTYEHLQEGRKKQWEQQARQVTQKNVEIANSVIEEMTTKIPGLKEDPELLDEIKSTLHGVAGGNDQSEKWTPFEIMRHIAAAKTLTKVLGIQNQVIQGNQEQLTAKDEEIAKLKKDLEEKDSFISSRANGMPRSESFSSSKADDGKPRSLLDSVTIRVPGHNS